jgi:hypothetical protein
MIYVLFQNTVSCGLEKTPRGVILPVCVKYCKTPLEKKENPIKHISFFHQLFQTLPDAYNKRERRDLNNLLKTLCAKLQEKFPATDLLKRDIPQPPVKDVTATGDREVVEKENITH